MELLKGSRPRMSTIDVFITLVFSALLALALGACANASDDDAFSARSVRDQNDPPVVTDVGDEPASGTSSDTTDYVAETDGEQSESTPEWLNVSQSECTQLLAGTLAPELATFTNQWATGAFHGEPRGNGFIVGRLNFGDPSLGRALTVRLDYFEAEVLSGACFVRSSTYQENFVRNIFGGEHYYGGDWFARASASEAAWHLYEGFKRTKYPDHTTQETYMGSLVREIVQSISVDAIEARRRCSLDEAEIVVGATGVVGTDCEWDWREDGPLPDELYSWLIAEYESFYP